ncbi:unnamed protein product [Camellia sinensis]
MMASVKLPRVSRSPSIKAAVSSVGAQENKNSTQTQMEMRSSIGSDTKFRKVLESATSDRTEFASTNEGSSVSEKIPNGEAVLKNPISSNSGKRKEGLRGKSNSVNATMAAEAKDDPNTKRFKPNEGSGSENDSVKIGDEDEKQTKANQKPPEPPKDYIHVRARRGQATDSHSLAERVQKEKISERMKLLQDLVPGLVLQNQTRHQWIGNKRSQNRTQVPKPKLSNNVIVKMNESSEEHLEMTSSIMESPF